MLSYIEGVIEFIEEEGVLKQATEVGSEEKRDAIFMEKIVYFRSALGDLFTFTITKDKFKNELEIGHYYYLFLKDGNIKEIYKDEEGLKQNLDKGLLQGNQKGRDNSDKIGFMGTIGIAFIIGFVCFALSVIELSLVSLSAILLDSLNIPNAIVETVRKFGFIESLSCTAILNFFSLVYLCNKASKKELKQRNKLVADFRGRMKIDTQDKNISSNIVLPEKVAVLK